MTALQWIAIALVCLGLEIASTGFWFMWLAIAGFLLAFLSVFGIVTALALQFLIFAAISLILVIFTRPLLMRFVHVKDRRSNTDALIGKTGIVIVPISSHAFGQVKINGEIWTAAANLPLEEGEIVQVVAVDGVKLRVRPVSSENSEK